MWMWMCANISRIDSMVSAHFVHGDQTPTMTKSIFERNSSTRSSSNNAPIQLIRLPSTRDSSFFSTRYPAINERFALDVQPSRRSSIPANEHHKRAAQSYDEKHSPTTLDFQCSQCASHLDFNNFFFEEDKRKRKKAGDKKEILGFSILSRLIFKFEFQTLKYIYFLFSFFHICVKYLVRQEEENKVVEQKVGERIVGESCWKIKSWHPWQFFIYRVVRLMLLLRNGQLPPSSMVIYRFASPLTPTYTSLSSLPTEERGWKAIKPAVNSALLFAQRCAKRGPAL